MEASLKYHVSAFTASLSTKLVQIRQNPPLCLQSTPRGTQGFGKAGVFFVKSRAEPPTGSSALYKGRGLSNISDAILSYTEHFVNAFQPVAYRRPAVMCLCCNVRQRKPLNVPQKSNLSVYPPKRCAFDGGGHLLSVKSLQRSGQHYTSSRHR